MFVLTKRLRYSMVLNLLQGIFGMGSVQLMRKLLVEMSFSLG